MEYLLRDSFIAHATSVATQGIPFVPLNFWYFCALFVFWYFLGFLIDGTFPNHVTRDSRLPVKLWGTAIITGLAWLYLHLSTLFPGTVAERIEEFGMACILPAAAIAAGAIIPPVLKLVSIERSRFKRNTVAFGLFLDSTLALGAISAYSMNDTAVFGQGYNAGFVVRLGAVMFAPLGFQIGLFLLQRRSFAPGREFVWESSTRWSPAAAVTDAVRRWQWPHYLVAAVVLWIFGCLIVQDQSAAAKMSAIALLLFFFLLWAFPRLGRYRWMLYALLLLCALLGECGSYHLAFDLALLGAGLAVGTLFFHWASARRSPHLQTKTFAFAVVVTWLLWSGGDLVRVAPAPRDPARFSRPAKVDSLAAGKRIGLALSGGGYRAALMHAGVLTALEEIGIRPTNIAAVSGGSITASYYVSGGTGEDLLHAFQSHRFLLYRDLLDAQNALRLPFPMRVPGTHARLLPWFAFSRTQLQQEALDRVLLGGMTFGRIDIGAPKLMIGVTDLNSGSAVGITGKGVISRFLLRVPGEEDYPNVNELYAGKDRLSQASDFYKLDRSQDTQPLSKSVAASAALPPAFEPLLMALALDPVGRRRYLLADGGITDNSGMTLLLEADRRASLEDPRQGDPDWLLDLAISSHGGALFTSQADGSGNFGRAIDVIFGRIGLQLPEGPRGPRHGTPPPKVLLSPTVYIDNSRSDVDLSRIAFQSPAFDSDQPERWNTAIRIFYNHSADGRDALPLNDQQQTLVTLLGRQLSEIDASGVDLMAAIFGGSSYSIDRLRNAQGGADHQPVDRAAVLDDLASKIVPIYSYCLQNFLNTPTLKDSFNPVEAVILFRLGEYLVLLNEHEIRTRLAASSHAEVEPLLTPAEQNEFRCRLELEAKAGSELLAFPKGIVPDPSTPAGQRILDQRYKRAESRYEEFLKRCEK